MNTAHTTAWSLFRAVLQGVSLLLMARHFGPGGYGAIVGAVAIYATAAQLVGLGSGIGLLRSVSRDLTKLEAHLRATQGIYLACGFAGFILVWPLSTYLLPVTLSGTALAALAAAEIIAAPAILPTAYALQAQERMGYFGLALAMAPLARLGALLVCVAMGSTGIETFAYLYCAALFTVASIFVAAAFRTPQLRKVDRRRLLAEGLPYAVTGAASTAGTELDKTVVLTTLGAEAAGQYAAPFRIVQAAMLPALSLSLAVSPRLFKAAGNSGSRLNGMVGAVALYAAVAGLGLFAAAPLLPAILGEGFESSETILVMLLPLLFLSCIRQLLGASLTSLDMQWRRNILELAGAVSGVLLLLVLVPIQGIAGVVFALTAVEFFYVAFSASWLFSVKK